MRTVLFLIDTLQTGGAETSLLEITSRFKEYKPVFIQLFAGNELLPTFKGKGIEVIQMNLKPDYRFGEMMKKVLPVAMSYHPVLIHSTLFRSDMVGRKLARRLRVPLVNSLVNNSYSSIRFSEAPISQRLKLRVIMWWDRLTCRTVDLFLSNSKAIKQSNALALAIPEDKIKVIYRGRALNEYHVTDELRKKTRESLGIGSEKIFLNVSRLLNRKGQVDLIKAFAKFAPHCPEAQLWIAGEGQFRGQLENEIKKNTLDGKVRLLGNRKDVPNLLRSADYFVFPSHYEGLPGALVEAMMARIPIIASAIPENLECVDSSMALLYPRGEIDRLVDCLFDAVGANWTERVERSFRKAVNAFDIEMVAKQHEDAYNILSNTVNKP